jgi:hypothetical protein
MAAKLTKLTHKRAIQLHLVAEGVVPFAVLAPGAFVHAYAIIVLQNSLPQKYKVVCINSNIHGYVKF